MKRFTRRRAAWCFSAMVVLALAIPGRFMFNAAYGAGAVSSGQKSIHNSSSTML